ncbi:hypothetical protein [Planosporangium mesophilum]|nr:hypothetical protein [Planosporangium mesophilum]
MSFLLFECMVALAVLLGLAELTSWWAVAALPVAVAAMVKLNDLVAGAVGGGGQGSRAVGSRRYGEHRDNLATEVTPAFDMPGMARAEARSSRVYVSGAYAAVPGSYPTGADAGADRMTGARAGRADTTAGLPGESRRFDEPTTVGLPRESRRFDETTQHNGLQRRVAAGNPAGGRTGNSRGRQHSAESEDERAALVRPEWRQTVTLGRHTRRDDSRAGNGRQAGPHLDAHEGRHQGGQPNRHRFA